jgi:transcriptional regulator with GAF, ATPase, and Fis domain
MYFYRNYQDFDAYGAAVRTLAEGRNQFSEEQNDMIKHFERYGTRELIGKSPMIKHLRSLIEKVGPKDSARVLIWGETGTGKETVALQLHFKSPRKREPFIVANCATLSPQLLLSQLFGHKKGAFTGAVENHDGYFKQADGGTLFLDEIGELPPEAQAGLLRVLQEGRFNRLGETGEIKVNVRVIAATNRNLAEMVRDGRFRDDLFHRLNMVHIHISPLRERPEDIGEIANAFWMNRHKRRLEPEQLVALAGYDWPGNVRELYNVLELADILDEQDFSKLLEENRRQWGMKNNIA